MKNHWKEIRETTNHSYQKCTDGVLNNINLKNELKKTGLHKLIENCQKNQKL